MVIIGAGQVSRELAPVWQKAGHTILQVISRTENSARPLGELLGCPWTTTLGDAAGALSDAQIVVVAVTDGLIAEVAETISTMISPKCVMIHLSGATPLEALRHPCAVRLFRGSGREEGLEENGQKIHSIFCRHLLSLLPVVCLPVVSTPPRGSRAET